MKKINIDAYTNDEIKEILTKNLEMPSTVDKSLEETFEKIRTSPPNTVRQPQSKTRRLAPVLVAAVLLIAFTTAFAKYVVPYLGNYEDDSFFNGLFGDTVQDPQQGHVDYEEVEGYKKEIYYPTIERVPVDDVLADELLRPYMSTEMVTKTIGDYTVTIISNVIDKQTQTGSMVISLHAEGQTGIIKGLEYSEETGELYFFSDREAMEVGETFLYIRPEGTDGTMLSEYMVYDEESSTDDAMIIYISYAAFGLKEDEGIGLVFSEGTIIEADQELMEYGYNHDAHFEELGSITAPDTDSIPSLELSRDGNTFGYVSALGLSIDKYLAPILSSVVIDYAAITYKDGTTYVIQDEDENGVPLMNYNNGIIRESPDYTGNVGDVGIDVYSFNRLVDISKIESITVNGLEIPVN